MSGKHLLFSISTGECIIFNCCLFIVCSLYCVFFCATPGFSLGFIIWSVRHSSWVMNTFSLCSVLPSCAGTCERICFTRSAYIKHLVSLCWIFIDSLSLLLMFFFLLFAGAFHVCTSSISCVLTNGSSLTRNAPSAEWTSRFSYQRVDAIFLATLLLDMYLLFSLKFLSVMHSTKDGMKYLRNYGKKEKQRST